MASKFRNLIAAKSRQVLSTMADIVDMPTHRQIINKMKLDQNTTSMAHPITFTLPTSSIGLAPHESQISNFIKTFETDSAVPSVSQNPNSELLTFAVDRDTFFAREVAVQLRREKQGYEWLRDGLFPDESPVQVIVEFSSPNVAKPFHMGHLRSTIVGNFVANIHDTVGHKVNKINFLGDWGTQFGYLAVGLQESGKKLDNILDSDGESSIRRLNEIYVEANQKSEKDPGFVERAKTCFAQLENGDPSLMKDWQRIRDLTVSELERVYNRLGVHFHHYHGESMYGPEQMKSVLKIFEEKSILRQMKDGRQVVDVKDRQVVVTKSDGTSLYITRDVAAAIDRQNQFNPQKVLYVVETGQSNHFENLFEILSKCQFEWSKNLSHINFGRIEGMSTRKGTAVFLSDILNEGRDEMLERLSQMSNTKVESEEQRWEVADILATTAVIVNDLKQRRSRNYVFSWEHALHSKGDSGIKLQYTHARITSLLAMQDPDSRIDFVSELLSKPNVMSHLREPEAVAVVFQLGRFGEVLRDSYIGLESSYLVLYLFRLCNLTSKALKVLNVKGQEPDISFARLALFAGVRAVLRQGMRVLGIRPLDKM